MYACMHAYMYVMHVCMHVCMYVCMYCNVCGLCDAPCGFCGVPGGFCGVPGGRLRCAWCVYSTCLWCVLGGLCDVPGLFCNVPGGLCGGGVQRINFCIRCGSQSPGTSRIDPPGSQEPRDQSQHYLISFRCGVSLRAAWLRYLVLAILY